MAWLKSPVPTRGSSWILAEFLGARGGQVSGAAGDCVVVGEDDPIVRVVAYGSPPGCSHEACKEVDSWRRDDEIRGIMRGRFRAGHM